MIAFTKRILAAALAGVCALFSCCGTDEVPDGHAPDGSLAMRPLLEGGTSAIRSERCAVVRDEDAWRMLWHEHAATSLPRPPAPEVDFASEMVVAVFLGERPTAGYRVAVRACVPGDATLAVHAAEEAPGDETFQAQVLTAPFAMVVTPRVGGEPALTLLRADG